MAKKTDNQAQKPPKPPSKRGRRTTLTYEKVDKVCEYLKLGHFIETACKLSGVKERTWFHWIKCARDRKRPSKIQLHLLQSLDASEAQCEHLLVTRVLADKSSKTALEMLSRRWPERWGVTQKNINRNVDKDGEDIKPHGVLVVPGQMDEKEWAEAAERYKEHQPTAEESADGGSSDSVH